MSALGRRIINRTCKSFLREFYILHNNSKEVVQRAGDDFIKPGIRSFGGSSTSAQSRCCTPAKHWPKGLTDGSLFVCRAPVQQAAHRGQYTKWLTPPIKKRAYELLNIHCGVDPTPASCEVTGESCCRLLQRLQSRLLACLEAEPIVDAFKVCAVWIWFNAEEQ